MLTEEKGYRPRAIKRRRRTKDDLAQIQDAIIDCLHGDNPQSVRHVYYRLVGPPYSVVPKDQSGYRVVHRECLRLRRADKLPWHWVSDGTRWRRVRTSFDTMAEAVRYTADSYRRDLWRRTPVYVEVWCESDSIAGVLIEETDRYNVPLMVSRGFSSDTYLYNAAQDIEAQGRPAYLYFIGDWDPSGKIIPEKIEAGLRRHAPGCEITFQRLLVTPDQIVEWRLPTKPVKKTTHASGFTGGTVEAEAIPAATTRRLVREAIEQHLDMREVEVMREAERSEAALLHSFADKIKQGRHDFWSGV
jgi:hypothetical protein